MMKRREQQQSNLLLSLNWHRKSTREWKREMSAASGEPVDSLSVEDGVELVKDGGTGSIIVTASDAFKVRHFQASVCARFFFFFFFSPGYRCHGKTVWEE